MKIELLQDIENKKKGTKIEIDGSIGKRMIARKMAKQVNIQNKAAKPKSNK